MSNQAIVGHQKGPEENSDSEHSKVADAKLEKKFLRLLEGKWITAAVSNAAALGLGEALSEPKTLDELSHHLGCEPHALARLLGVIEGLELVEQRDEKKYHLTALGALLQKDKLGAVSTFVGAPFSWNPWSTLHHAMRQGVSAFELHHGQPLFEHLEHHPDDAAIYHDGVDAFTRREACVLADIFDFSSVKSIADVGGGRGTLLLEVLMKWPHLKGVLIDRAPAPKFAQEVFEGAGLGMRCRALEADFFEPLSVSVDVCIVKHVIHNWDDDHARTILSNCKNSVGPHGEVLVIEGILLPGNQPDMMRFINLEMLALCGKGHERTKPALRRLLRSAGLRVVQTRPLANGSHVLICQPLR